MIVITIKFLKPIMTPDESKQLGFLLVCIIGITILINWLGIISKFTFSLIYLAFGTISYIK